jgi:hypothetical protein
MKRRLPIGIQDFVKIREDGCVYVDKTARIYELLTGSGTAIFLSRPRRFGKSLLCSTLAAIFEGRRELFGGLAIDSLDWDWKKHPVVRIDLNAGDFNKCLDELFITLNRSLDFAAQNYNVPIEGESSGDRFARLVKALHTVCGERVVVIIDEYDKPLLNTIDNSELHKEIRSALKAFYGVLKSADEHLRFVLLTGVTKFAQVSVFSDLNHLMDLTLDPRYADLCGVTQEELERDFAPEIDRVLDSTGRGREDYLDRLKHYYNGYQFSDKPLTVYNPFGLLKHFDAGGNFFPYWFETGTPSFLIKLIENQHIDVTRLEEYTVSFNQFSKYDAENMDAVAILYQSGYLTIKTYNEKRQTYSLDYPNEEVRSCFADALAEVYLKATADGRNGLMRMLPEALEEGDVTGALEAVKSFLATIPYDLAIEQERYYQTVVYIMFRMLGLNCRAELRTAAGRIDAVVETEGNVYCFEFKLHKGGRNSEAACTALAEEALAQIDRKEYLLAWKGRFSPGSGKKLFKVGVAFDQNTRNIGVWKCTQL